MARHSAAALARAINYELEIGASATEIGEFAYSVLTAVIDRRYPIAVEMLNEYKRAKKSYPMFQRQTDRLFAHAEELINAVGAKKNFPNLTSLVQSKQDELHQKARENFEDLKLTLRRLRSIEKDLAAGDARSSIWVIWSLLFSVTMILGTFIINEAFRSFGRSLPIFLDQLVKEILAFFSFQ